MIMIMIMILIRIMIPIHVFCRDHDIQDIPVYLTQKPLCRMFIMLVGLFQPMRANRLL